MVSHKLSQSVSRLMFVVGIFMEFIFVPIHHVVHMDVLRLQDLPQVPLDETIVGLVVVPEAIEVVYYVEKGVGFPLTEICSH